MKVIFDISSVGYHASSRTGVARVAWTLTDLLHQQLGDDLSFSATGSIAASLQVEKLLADYPDLQSAICPISNLAKTIDRLNSQATSNNSHFGNNLLQKGKQSALLNISRLLNITRRPIDPQKLAVADLFHSTYPRIPQQVRTALPNRHLQTVYDLTPLILDEKYVPPGHCNVTKRLIDTIQPNDWVTTISNSARDDLLNRRPHLNPDRVITIYLAAAAELFYPVSDRQQIEETKQKYQLPEGDYFLSLHSLAPHKNMEHLITCFKQIISQEKIVDLHLVICGGNKNSLSKVIEANHLTATDLKNIHFAGFVEDRDLAAIYSGAVGFIFPSLYEGFGLPLLEAMQCGCPAISSNTSSMPEVVGAAGFLVSPRDGDALCAAMLELYRSHELRANYARLSVERSSLFSWEKTVDETLAMYTNIIQSDVCK